MKKFLDFLSIIEGWLAVISVTVMTALVVLDVLSRELFNSGFPWAQKSAVFLMIWAGYLGAILVSNKASHLRPQIADKLWGDKGQIWFIRIQNFVTLIFCSLFSYAAILYVIDSQDLGDKSVVTGIPLWILQLVIPYTFFSMALRNVYFMLHPNEQLLIAKDIH